MHKKKKTERQFKVVNSMSMLCDVLREHGSKNAFMWFDRSRNLHNMSYRELSDSILFESAGLASLGFSDKRVAIVGETSPEWVASYISVVASGNVAIPLDRELDFNELLGFLEFAEADAVIYSGAFNAKFAPVIGTLPTVKYFIPMSPEGDTENPAVMSLSSLKEKGKAVFGNYTFPLTNQDRMAVMLFTSGTTGTSKCVMLSERNVIAAVNSAGLTVEFFPDDTIVSTLPLHHTYELCCMLAALGYGMNIGINDSLKHLIKNYQEFKPTGLVLVPLIVNTFYKRVWDEAKKTGKDKKLTLAMTASELLRKVGIDARRKFFAEILNNFGGRINKIICGGAAMNPTIAECLEELGIDVYEGYGITECSPLISVNPYYAPKRGSVGPSVPCCRVRIDAERINDKGFEEGEIQVRGDNVMLGYYKNPEATAEAFTFDGWFCTGDIGYMDKDGYIFITGRKKFVIVLENGKNVFPEEIEDKLVELPKVSEGVVIGRKKGENVILTAIVYPDLSKFPANASDDEILDTLRKDIAVMNRGLVSYKQIKAVELRRTEFEKTTSKKIKRHLLS